MTTRALLLTGLLTVLPLGSTWASEPPAVSREPQVMASIRSGVIGPRLMNVIKNDPALRAEIRRVGFEKGCRAMADSSREVTDRYGEILKPEMLAAIRDSVPTEVLAGPNYLTFLGGPLIGFRRRITTLFERAGAEKLAAADAEVRDAFLKRTRPQPDTTDPSANIVKPRDDINAVFGYGASYDLDHPAQLGLACSDLLIHPAVRPKITVGPPPL